MNSQIAWSYLVNFLSGEFQSQAEAEFFALKTAENVGKVDINPPVTNKL
jgi:hypothetical protein